MAKFTLKNLFNLLHKDTPVDRAWLKEQKLWLINYAQKNPVRNAPLTRLTGRKGFVFPFVLNLKRSPMFVSLILAASLILGGGGVVAAAQNDLPNEPFYGVKIASEKVRVAVTANTETRAELRAQFAKRRLNEMAKISADIKISAEARAIAVAKAEENYRANMAAASSEIIKTEPSATVSAENSAALKLDNEVSAQEQSLIQLEAEAPKEAKQAIRRALMIANETRKTVAALKAGLAAEAEARAESMGTAQVQAEAGGEAEVGGQEDATNAPQRKDISLIGERARTEGRIIAAEHKLKTSTEVVTKIEEKNGVQAEAKAKLNLANEALIRAKAEFKSRDYKNAWLNASASIKLAVEAALIALKSNTDVDLGLDINQPPRVIPLPPNDKVNILPVQKANINLRLDGEVQVR
ncbi:hypothetical protein HYT45_04215 [Candidatus Uhrbacteria bacterium]|nr:hypothetical protein [Candidatus Uhrbacteria bacterium]